MFYLWKMHNYILDCLSSPLKHECDEWWKHLMYIVLSNESMSHTIHFPLQGWLDIVNIQLKIWCEKTEDPCSPLVQPLCTICSLHTKPLKRDPNSGSFEQRVSIRTHSQKIKKLNDESQVLDFIEKKRNFKI